MLPILPLILCVLIALDLASTLYGVHRSPEHAFENGKYMLRAIAWVGQEFPAMRASIARDLVLVVTAALSIAAVYALTPYLPPLPYWPVWLAAILFQARTVLLNAQVIRGIG